MLPYFNRRPAINMGGFAAYSIGPTDANSGSPYPSPTPVPELTLSAGIRLYTRISLRRRASALRLRAGCPVWDNPGLRRQASAWRLCSRPP
jgi:hypothetical protein